MRHREAILFATREDRDLLIDIITREEEGAEDAAELSDGFVSGGLEHLFEDGGVEVEGLNLVLGEVLDRDVVTEG